MCPKHVEVGKKDKYKVKVVEVETKKMVSNKCPMYDLYYIILHNK